MEREPMTPQGHQKLVDEIAQIKKVERPANIAAIEEARLNGDLSENADYHAAKEKQGLIDARLKMVEDLVARAEVIDITNLSGPDVKFGATVTLVDVDTEEEYTYQIVGKPESDPKANRISIQSPIGQSLIGKEEGDEVTVKTPSGMKQFGIVSVQYSSK